MKSSFGIMVNYRYVLNDVHSNSQAYLMDRTIPATKSVQDLAQKHSS